MKVYIIYRTKRDNSMSPDLWEIYDNEIEALRECNFWNAEKGVYSFFCASKEVKNLFEI